RPAPRSTLFPYTTLFRSQVKDKKIFRTVALAGTQAWRPGVDPRKVSWTQKEIEEQALVERYIISCFKSVRLREYEEQGPRTVVRSEEHTSELQSRENLVC